MTSPAPSPADVARALETRPEPGPQNTPAAPPVTGSGDLSALLDGLGDDVQRAVRSEIESLRKENARMRTRAREFADDGAYDRAKAALTKLDEIEQAQKTAEQRERDAREAATRERDEARAELLRERIGRRHRLPDVFVSLLRGTDEGAVEEQAKAIAAELDAARSRPGDAVPRTPAATHSPGSSHSDEIDPDAIAVRALGFS